MDDVAGNGGTSSAAYEERWKALSAQGEVPYSRTGDTTPMLDSVIGYGRNSDLRVASLGAGRCVQEIEMARNGIDVVCVESCPDTVAVARESIRDELGEYPWRGSMGGIEVVESGIFDYIRQLRNGEHRAFYANSVLHTVRRPDRLKLLRELHARLPGADLVYASFKSTQDDVFELSSPVEGDIKFDPIGEVRRDEFGIVRTFVSTPVYLTNEFAEAGFEVVNSWDWSVPGYDPSPEAGRELVAHFFGVVAMKKTG